MVRSGPFLIIAVAVFVGTLMAFIGFGYGPAAILFSGVFAAPVAVVWFRPMLGWACPWCRCSALLPADRIVFGYNLRSVLPG